MRNEPASIAGLALACAGAVALAISLIVLTPDGRSRLASMLPYMPEPLLVAANLSMDNPQSASDGELSHSLQGIVNADHIPVFSRVEIVSANGRTQTLEIQPDGTFASHDVSGTSPFMLRVQRAVNSYPLRYLYALAYPGEQQRIAVSVNSYSDFVLRNWYSSRYMNIAHAFKRTSGILAAPNSLQLSRSQAALYQHIESLTSLYGFAEPDLFTAITAEPLRDEFIRDNPVVIDGGRAHISIRHPDTGHQSMMLRGFDMSSDMLDADDSPPDPVYAVDALLLPGARAQVIWRGAQDSHGVVGFHIYADDNLIATTPFNSVEIDHVSAVSSYTVTAVDAAGNESMPVEVRVVPRHVSRPGASWTGSGTMHVQPQTHSIALLAQRAGSLAGRVTFYRINPDSSHTLLASTYGAALVDFQINPGSEYCYYFVADIENGSQLGASSPVCSTAQALAGPGKRPHGVDDYVVGAAFVIAPVNKVDEQQVCQHTLGRRVTIDVRLEPGCYLAPDGLDIADNVSLTLSAGVTIRFGKWTGLRTGRGRLLKANGLVNDPVVLTGMRALSGYWQGVTVENANITGVELNAIIIEYATNNIDIQTRRNPATSSVVLIQDSIFRHASGYGMSLSLGTAKRRILRNRFVGNSRPIRVNPDYVAELDAGSQYVGNAEDVISIASGVLTKASRWHHLQVPYLSGSVTLKSDLVIDAGTTIMFENQAQLTVHDGSIHAAGTAAAPIQFTGKHSVPGFWNGISFDYPGDASAHVHSNTLEHVQISYAAGDDPFSGALTINRSSGAAYYSMSHVRFAQNRQYGFSFRADKALNYFNNIISTENGASAVATAPAVSGWGDFISLAGNSRDEIYVPDGAVDSALTLADFGVPVSVGRLTLNNAVNVLPGVSLQVRNSGHIRVLGSGSLKVLGSAQLPVSFVSADDGWEGIVFNRSNNHDNILDHVRILGAGRLSDISSDAALMMRCTDDAPGWLSVSNTVISDSEQWAMSISDRGCNLSMADSVDMSNNRNGELLIRR